MTNWKRMLVFCVLACLVMAWIPVSASAVDPVSAATMANALAQAITAYGASQGVSMTFDVTNTDGIGEGVHDIWDDFKEDVQDPDIPSYDSFAVTVWSTLFSKVGDKVAFNLDANSVYYFDSFWNWLLSGPAEMTKVDNQYYEWNVNQNTGNVDPIDIYSYIATSYNGIIVYSIPRSFPGQLTIIQTNTSGSAYSICVRYSTNQCIIFSVSDESFTGSFDTPNNINLGGGNSALSNGGWYYLSCSLRATTSQVVADITQLQSTPPDIDSILGNRVDDSVDVIDNSITVIPYVGDTAPQNVYIPDNTDVNYEPIPAEITTDISWDDALFGDGTDTLTDAQSEAITQAVDQAITDNPAKTLELADTANPPAPAPGEVYIPFLPVTLPSFNFNFSGIWHYVVEWIGSLGAWFTMVLLVWANLPYAITVPVYASLVILIVLGVYRRFLS